MNEEEYLLELGILHSVTSRIKDRPEFMSDVIKAMTQGQIQAVEEYKQLASDMEVLASTAFMMAVDKGRVSKKTKDWFETIAQSKIEKHYGKSFVPWDQILKKLEMNT